MSDDEDEGFAAALEASLETALIESTGREAFEAANVHATGAAAASASAPPPAPASDADEEALALGLRLSAATALAAPAHGSADERLDAEALAMALHLSAVEASRAAPLPPAHSPDASGEWGGEAEEVEVDEEAEALAWCLHESEREVGILGLIGGGGDGNNLDAEEAAQLQRALAESAAEIQPAQRPSIPLGWCQLKIAIEPALVGRLIGKGGVHFSAIEAANSCYVHATKGNAETCSVYITAATTEEADAALNAVLMRYLQLQENDATAAAAAAAPAWRGGRGGSAPSAAWRGGCGRGGRGRGGSGSGSWDAASAPSFSSAALSSDGSLSGLLRVWWPPERMPTPKSPLHPSRMRHVFVDHSNTWLCAAESPEERPLLNVRGLVALLAAGGIGGAPSPPAPGARRYVVGSKGRAEDASAAEWAAAYEREGFVVKVIARDYSGREDAVDSVLHAGLQSLIIAVTEDASAPPGTHTLVLATGDGNCNDGVTSFPGVAFSAAIAGLRVEVWGWMQRGGGFSTAFSRVAACFGDGRVTLHSLHPHRGSVVVAAGH